MKGLAVSSLALLGLLSSCSARALPEVDEACTRPSPTPTYKDQEYYGKALAVENNPNELRSALTSIISANYIPYSYSCMWDVLQYVDEDPTNTTNVLLVYSQSSFPKWMRDTGSETIAWNREHVWPKSHGFPSESSYPYNDAHHLRPSDKRVNNRRNDKDFDNGGTPFCVEPYLSTSGCKAMGADTSTTFEVPDGHKGDVARMMFYMDVRYEGQSGKEPDITLVDRSTSRTSEPFLGFLCTLLEWARQDPVAEQERRRNERTFHWHLNRNPFIDHPEWIEVIFGPLC